MIPVDFAVQRLSFGKTLHKSVHVLFQRHLGRQATGADGHAETGWCLFVHIFSSIMEAGYARRGLLTQHYVH